MGFETILVSRIVLGLSSDLKGNSAYYTWAPKPRPIDYLKVGLPGNINKQWAHSWPGFWLFVSFYWIHNESGDNFLFAKELIAEYYAPTEWAHLASELYTRLCSTLINYKKPEEIQRTEFVDVVLQVLLPFPAVVCLQVHGYEVRNQWWEMKV